MKYEYKDLERSTDSDGRRVYTTPEGTFHSVTTILSATADQSGLDAWIEWVGKDKANKIRDEAAALGTLMHEHIESHLLEQERPRGNNLIRQMARSMADVIIDKGLSVVDSIWGIEAQLYHPDGYAGTTDLVGIHNGSPAIMDFKTARKMKNDTTNNDYYCQCVAYMLAHNHLYGTNINKVVIFMVTREGDYKEFVKEGDELQFYIDQWNNRVTAYKNMVAAGII